MIQYQMILLCNYSLILLCNLYILSNYEFYYMIIKLTN